jgi:hypothetical protein
MLKLNRINQACAVALALVFPGAAMAADAPAGQLLFVSGLVTIVDTKGIERPATKGDKIGPGERLVTGGGAIGQIKLSDGSLIGLRSDSDLKLDAMKPADVKGPAERVMFLSKGAVRVVNVDSGDREKHLPVLLQTPTATIGLRNADNESIVVPTTAAGGVKPVIDPGTYSRMAVGDGVIKTTGGETSLGASQTAFAATGSTSFAPTRIAAMPELLTKTLLPAAAGGTVIPAGSPAFPDRMAVPVTGLTPPSPAGGLNLATPTSLGTRVIATLTPTGGFATSSVILQPVKAPTLVDTGSIDVSTVSIAKLSTLPTATLATLPQATLQLLPPATLATLPPTTIKSLSPAVQATVSPLLTITQQTAVTNAVAAPIKTTTTVPITTTTTLRAIKF